MPQSIPAASVLCATISLLVAFVLPIGLGVLVCKRHGKGTFRAILIGAFCFIVSAMVLEQVLHIAVFTLFPGLAQNLPLYGLYAGLAAGIFEETGRFFGLKYLCKHDAAPEIGFAYGVGHGGIEAIFLLGLAMVSNLAAMTAINSGNGDALLNGLDSAAQATVTTQMAQLAATPAANFLAGGLERIVAITLHLSLSMLVYLAVTKRVGMWGYPLAIALHAVTDFFAVFYQMGVITNIWLFEALAAALVACVAALVVWLYRKHPAPAATL